MSKLLAVIALALAALAACGGDDNGTAGTGTSEGTGTTGTTAATAPTTVPSVTGSPPPTSGGPAASIPPGDPIDPSLPLVTGAVEDLARRLGIEPDAVTVVEARAVTWPDGSLGCPEPGMLYPQVLVDGVFVLLEAQGRQYRYHGGDPLFLCEPGKGPFAPES